MSSPATAAEPETRAVRHRGAIKTQWVRLKTPYAFNGFRFLVEVRARDNVVTTPSCQSDVRVREPLCSTCGAPLALVKARPECERYVCRHGAGHCELWVGRVSHLTFGEFMREQLRPRVYYALRRGLFPLEPAAMGAALNLMPY